MVNLLFQNLGIQFNSLNIHKEPRLLLILAVLVKGLLVESNEGVVEVWMELAVYSVFKGGVVLVLVVGKRGK